MYFVAKGFKPGVSKLEVLEMFPEEEEKDDTLYKNEVLPPEEMGYMNYGKRRR